MPKIIVTHTHPDLDAIMASWLFVRFDQPRYGDAELVYVRAGETYKNEPADSDDDIIHVDTGRGAFDHHQPGAPKTCAAKLVYEYLLAGGQIDEDDLPLKEMVDFALEIDHFQDLYWPETNHPRYTFMLQEIIPALHSLQRYDDEGVARLAFAYLDGVYQKLKEREKAKEVIDEGQEFESAWGKGIAVEAEIEDLSKIAQRMGYTITVTRNPKKQFLKIKTAPHVPLALKALYDKIVQLDGPEKWFYHNSGHILLNGSDKGGPKAPTTITLDTLLELIHEISSSQEGGAKS